MTEHAMMIVSDEDRLRHAEDDLRRANSLLARAVDLINQTTQTKHAIGLLLQIRDHIGQHKFDDALSGDC